MAVAAGFPVPLDQYKVVALDPKQPKLTAEQKAQLEANIQLCRDAIVFFTAIADAKGLGGHTGGPYDTVPETLIMHGFMEHARQGGTPDVLPVFFDEAGHRVATAVEHAEQVVDPGDRAGAGEQQERVAALTLGFKQEDADRHVDRQEHERDEHEEGGRGVPYHLRNHAA